MFGNSRIPIATVLTALAILPCITLLCVGCRSESETPLQSTQPAGDSRITLEHARAMIDRGQQQQAYAAAQKILVAEPADVDALRIVAAVYESAGRHEEAAQIASELSTLDVPDPSGELLQAFTWRLRAGNYAAAEDDLRRAIENDPRDVRAHRALAQLLNAQGRRYEAHPHTIAIVRFGQISSLERMSLVEQGGPYQLVSYDEFIGDTSGTLFDLGKARHQYVADVDPQQALATVDRLMQADPQFPALQAFRGRLLVETLANEPFLAWLKQAPGDARQHPEYWEAVGGWLALHERDETAVRALGEAIRLDPTNRQSLRRLAASLSRLGKHQQSKRVQDTLATLDKIFRVAANADATQSIWIAQQLEQLTRPWESIAWYEHAFELQGTLNQRTEELRQRRQKITDWERDAGQERIRDARVAKMLGFDYRDFSMPEFDFEPPPEKTAGSSSANALRFADVAESVGVSTSFVSDYRLDKVDFYLHQANGGGLAAFDYDLDGRCDLYFAQSGGDPNQRLSSVSNQLFRQRPDLTFVEVSAVAGSDDRGYGQGVCAGDINQDGFPDLLVANIGRNVVYINQGDGTFRERSDLMVENSTRWTSSLAIGDLDGDQLPDIVEINYLDDPLIFQNKCQGQTLLCTPQRYRAATDRIFRSIGDGSFQSWGGGQSMDKLPNYGFGAVIADFDGQHGNDLFISNDGDLNHFWRSHAVPSITTDLDSGRDSGGDSVTAKAGRFGLLEVAGVTGCSIGASGLCQACMGIASGDFDRNGLLDLLITNFHNEPVNLFLQNESGFFVDESLRYQLAQPSTGVLGFGTQAADFDNDGWLDVAILNGHIYDARYANIPFRMASQLLRGGPRSFVVQDPEAAGRYWAKEQLGRTLATCDWNRDGRIDLVANHLDQPMAILQNESESASWIQLELVGVDSDRTAIGARVLVRAGGEDWTAWQTGGDGYMCSNEDMIHIGLGDADSIERVEIHWPSGATQRFESIDPNERYLAIEGEQLLFRR